MSEDDWGWILFGLFADWRIVCGVIVVLGVLSLTGVIPWGDLL